MQAAENITDHKALSDQLLVQNNELQITVATLRTNEENYFWQPQRTLRTY
jgi:hypothetical protein